ncbi:hypothetical protein PHYPSEUDO_001981 [Phytophthora pseudosyringae]|uniref:Methyltransferase domain-containing protein n=1 Tax=Phytophthora pseudosyringae TaxID=221518 RepID=A0A8T1VUN1_9STRA|nr:hypothetical protein PHYPSEUDO_001981 [Phytophthora pseudosyringae]
MAQRAAQTWQPLKYLKFERVRLRPALELLQRVPALPSAASNDDGAVEIMDLGAGTGNMAPSFFKRWPKAHVTFVDSSASMLERAKQEHSANDSVKSDQCTYVEADFESFQPEKPVDLIFSNAALHWVSSERHKQLMPRLFSLLKPGGTLAFQIPDTRLQPSHLLIGEAAKQVGHSDQVAHVRWVTCERDPGFYYELFKSVDKDVELDMWATMYAQVLEGDNPVADFVGSTGIRPFMEALGDLSTAATEFEHKYRELIAAAYAKQSDGRTIFNLKRFFVVATKASAVNELDWDTVEAGLLPEDGSQPTEVEVCRASVEDWDQFVKEESEVVVTRTMAWRDGKILVVGLNGVVHECLNALLGQEVGSATGTGYHHLTPCESTEYVKDLGSLPPVRTLESGSSFGPSLLIGASLPEGLQNFAEFHTFEAEVGVSRRWEDLDRRADAWRQYPGVVYILSIRVSPNFSIRQCRLDTVVNNQPPLPDGFNDPLVINLCHVVEDARRQCGRVD